MCQQSLSYVCITHHLNELYILLVKLLSSLHSSSSSLLLPYVCYVDVNAAIVEDESGGTFQKTNSSGGGMENGTVSTNSTQPCHSITRSVSYDTAHHRESITPQTVTRATSFDSTIHPRGSPGMLVLLI